MKIFTDYYLILFTIFIIATFLIKCLGDYFKKRNDRRGILVYRILMGLALRCSISSIFFITALISFQADRSTGRHCGCPVFSIVLYALHNL